MAADEPDNGIRQYKYQLPGATLRQVVTLQLADGFNDASIAALSPKLLKEDATSDLIDELVKKHGARMMDVCDENGSLIAARRIFNAATNALVGNTYYNRKGQMYKAETFDPENPEQITGITRWNPETGRPRNPAAGAAAVKRFDGHTGIQTYAGYYPDGVHRMDLYFHRETGSPIKIVNYNEREEPHDLKTGEHAITTFDRDGNKTGSVSYQNGVRLTPLPIATATTTFSPARAGVMPQPATLREPKPLPAHLASCACPNLKPA